MRCPVPDPVPPQSPRQQAGKPRGLQKSTESEGMAGTLEGVARYKNTYKARNRRQVVPQLQASSTRTRQGKV